ncbi:MAG TPA: aminoglycoside phosphotransferase family protein [Polyangiaceae bacterium]
MTTPAFWAGDAWLDAASDFIDAALRAHGRERTGPVTRARVRPWAALVEAPASGGRVWLKACCASTAFEVALYRQLEALVPARVLAPLGLDTERGWLVLPDGGTLLGHDCPGDVLATALERIAPYYAELQQTLMPHTAALLELGVSDMTPAVMPLRFEQALATARGFLERQDGAVDWRDYDAVAALASRFDAWCAALAESPGSPSLDHNDLHPWNIFATPAATESARFFDWGDSVLAHPFASLLVLLEMLRQTLDTHADDPRVLRVRDAYLEPFGALASRRELITTSALACRVAKAARVLTWQRAIGDEAPPDYAGIPFGKLLELLDEH